jgi:hypothetical protein
MGQKQDSRYCPHCQTRNLAIGRTPNHVLHLLLSICTAGLWLIVWLLVCAGMIGGYRCARCGTSV